MKKQVIKILRLYFLFTLACFANDSIYTSTQTIKILSEYEASSEMLLASPNGYIVTLRDGGGRSIQLSIERNNREYLLTTEKLADVIEWRMNKEDEIIGFIVRTFERIDNNRMLEESKYRSQLNIILFIEEPLFLGTESNNTKAREIMDDKYFLKRKI